MDVNEPPPRQFSGTEDDWHRLARTFALKVRVIPMWKGLGTALLVWSTLDDMPIEGEPMRTLNEMVESFEPCGADYTSVSVG